MDIVCYNMSYFTRKENIWFCLRSKQILSAENNARPNRDDSDHVLFMTIDVDPGSKRRLEPGALNDQIYNLTKSGQSHPDLGAS
jgi:hypothetical protein